MFLQLLDGIGLGNLINNLSCNLSSNTEASFLASVLPLERDKADKARSSTCLKMGYYVFQLPFF